MLAAAALLSLVAFCLAEPGYVAPAGCQYKGMTHPYGSTWADSKNGIPLACTCKREGYVARWSCKGSAGGGAVRRPAPAKPASNTYQIGANGKVIGAAAMAGRTIPTGNKFGEYYILTIEGDFKVPGGYSQNEQKLYRAKCYGGCSDRKHNAWLMRQKGSASSCDRWGLCHYVGYGHLYWFQKCNNCNCECFINYTTLVARKARLHG